MDRILKQVLVIFLMSVLLLGVTEVHGEGSASPLANLVSLALRQYALHLKTKRVDANVVDDNPETRGGYGHGGGGGGGGHGYGAITLDPVSIISLLALGAFLINNILQLLRANQTPATGGGRRSLNRQGIPEVIFRNLLNSNAHDGSGRDEGEPNFSQFFENVGSLYYLQPKKRNICIKKVVCGYINAQKAREEAPGNFKTSVFDFMLTTITRFVVPELTPQAPGTGKDEVCGKFNKLCSDSLLQDAKLSVKTRVYNEVTNIISSLTMRQLVG